MTLDAPPPPQHFVRPTDPETSLAAARRAAKASPLAVAAVRQVMADRRPRIDEEIRLACHSMGYVSSLATIQHGRLALSSAGFLRETGETRSTTNGMQSRVWVWVDAPAVMDPAAQTGQELARAVHVAKEAEYLHRQRAVKELRACQQMSSELLPQSVTEADRTYWWQVHAAANAALTALGETP